MRSFLFLLAFFFIGNLSATYAQSDFPYDEYKPRTIFEITSLDSDAKNADVVLEKKGVKEILLHANLLHSQVRVRFMNKSRPISADRKEVLDLWKKTLAIDDKVIALYENEYLFKECNDEYWIPVQKQVASYFPKELKESDMVSLFIIRIGGKKVGNSYDWLFLTNEFIK